MIEQTNKEKELQGRMAELLAKEYKLSKIQSNKLRATVIENQESLAKELAEENKVKNDKEKHDDTNRSIKNLNKHRIVG